MKLKEDMNQDWIEPFSSRELEVLQLVSDGLSNRKIAEKLTLSIETVKWYNKQIFLKLGVNSRIQAANKAKEIKLLDSTHNNPTQGTENAAGYLPSQISSYVGREREGEEIKALLRENRLVMLTGVGGSGKTRLALQVAKELQGEYPDGIWLVELASIREPSLVLPSIAKVLNIPENVDLPPIDLLKRALSRRHILLVIDNLEHLLDSAPLLSEILAAAPQLSILGTSRERLHISGEQEYPLSPLGLPDLDYRMTSDELKDVEAVKLFILRAKSANPGLSLDDESLDYIARICVRLDGLPLAIELCAPMVKVFSLGVIGERIENNLHAIPRGPRDLPSRQQTLIKTLQWSRDLLNENEKGLFNRLAIFNGGGTLNAIESICLSGISHDVVSLISSLVNKNLVLAQERRDGKIHFSLLETIRQFNLERLSTNGELNSLAKRHANYFSRLAEKSVQHILSSEQVTWIDKLEIEHDNLRAALAWYLNAQGQAESGLLLAASLEHFWGIRGYFSEGIDHLSAALSRSDAKERTLARANALHATGHLTYLQGRYPETRLVVEESLSIYREIDPIDQQGLANALITLGDMETELGNYSIAFKLMQEALEIMRELEDSRGISRALWQLGACVVRRGDYEQSVKYFEEALPLLRQVGDRGSTTIALSGLSEVAIRQGNYERATLLEEESLRLRREIDEPWGIAVSLGNFAWIALCQDDINQAESLLNESLTLRRDIGDRGGSAWCLEKLAEIALITGQRKSSPNSKVDFQRAARLFGAAEAIRKPVNSQIDLVDQPEYRRQVATIRKQVDESTFKRAWADGGVMSIEQAIEYALCNASFS